MSDVAIRRFALGDERAVNSGFNAAFHLDRSLDEWAWKFRPLRDGRLIMLAERDGEVLAHYAGVPARLHLDGRVWPAAQIVDVFSARSARREFTRRGVWVRTVDAFFDEFGRSGRVALLYGFPSPRPLRLGVLQLGYDAIPPQQIVYLSRRAVPRHVGLRRRLYRAEPARDHEARLDDLWRRVRGDYPVAVVRDAEHALNRFAGHPTVRYHRFLVFPRLSAAPVAWAVFRTDDGRCRLVDLLWDHQHPGALRLLAHLSGRLAAQVGAGLEELWLCHDSDGANVLSDQGFVASAESRKLVFVARCFDSGLPIAALDRRIYLTMSDSDLV